MKKAKKFLVYASVLFAIVLAGCQKNTPNSSSNPGSSQTPTSSQISSSSVITSDSSVTPSSSSTRPSSSTPSSSKSSSSTPSSSTPSSSKSSSSTPSSSTSVEPVDLVWTNDSFLVEAEDGLVQGVMTGTASDDSFIGERTSDNPEHPTSGGKVVFNWAEQGNTVTWKINAPEAEENIQITLWATCAFTQNSSGLSFSLNGTILPWNESTVNGKGSENKWYYWNALHTSGNLAQGENTIVVTNTSGESWNLDCLEMSKYVAPAIAFPENGRYRIEAESFINTSGGSVNIFDEETASNGKAIGDFFYPKSVSYEVITDQAYENLHLDAAYGLGQNNNENGAIEVLINGVKVHGRGWTQENHPAFDNIGMETTGWAITNVGSTNDFNLVEGKNTITLVAPYGSTSNIDYIELVEADAEPIDPIDPVEPTFTPIVWDEEDKFLVEAEDGLIEGMMTGSGEGDAFIGERTSDNPEHPTSGGKVVFNWQAVGNTVTFKLLADAAEENAQFTLWATCAFTQNSSGLSLSINGQNLSWVEPTVEGKGSENKWYYWNALHTSGNLAQGENTIVVTNTSGESWNLDCLEMSKYVAPAVDEFVNGTLRLEVENGVLGGGAAIIDQIEGETLSGGKGVGDFNGAASVTLTINSPEAMYVIADVRYALGMNNNQNQAVELHVNGVKIKGEIDNIGTDEITGWSTWTNGLSQIFQLVEGENTIVLKAPYGSYTNLDYIELKQQNVLSFTENTARVEAEDGVLAGGATISTNEALSGGKGVGDFNGTATVTIKFSLLEETEVYAKIRYALGMDNNQNQAVELHVNGVKIKGEIDNIGTDEITGWSNYVDGLSAQFTLVKGENTIELKVPYGSGANLDFIEFIKVVPTV